MHARLRFPLFCAVLLACSDGDAAREPEGSAPLGDAASPVGEAGSPDAQLGDADTPGDAASDAGPRLDAGSDAALDDPRDALQITVLREATDDAGVDYQLLRLELPERAPTYAQWFPPRRDAPRPVLVATKPYDGVDWTGEEVDTRWAALGPGLHPDVDSPDAGASPGVIAYQPLAPESVEDDTAWRLNGIGTLLLYGRFYTGGDVQNDIDDMTTGLLFLGRHPEVDAERIGIWGGSWGGFEAVYGAAYADARVKPRVGAAIAPLSDFERQVEFVQQDIPSLYTFEASRTNAATFFAPYLRRVEATRATRGGFIGLRAEDIAERITMPFLLVHDDWDTLVSFDQSERLVELAPQSFKPLWLRHAAPPLLWDQVTNSHGPYAAQYGGAGVSFLSSFLLSHLAPEDETVVSYFDAANVRALSNEVLARQREGMDMRFYAERLRDLADPRLTLWYAGSNTQVAATTAVADELNAVWGTNVAPEDVRAFLAQGLPPAP